MIENNEIPAGYVSDELYSQVTATFPIICTDVIVYDPSTQKIGVITRATGREAGKMALIGGRIKKDESITQAIARHLQNDLQIKNFSFYTGNTATRPFYVQQYRHADTINDAFSGYDPSKHSIALTYLIQIEETPQPKAEAAAFHWISESDIPTITAYNQGLLMHAAFDFIAETS